MQDAVIHHKFKSKFCKKMYEPLMVMLGRCDCISLPFTYKSRLYIWECGADPEKCLVNVVKLLW